MRPIIAQMKCQTEMGAVRFELPKPAQCNTHFAADEKIDPPVKITIKTFKTNLLSYESDGWICTIHRRKDKRLTYFLSVSHERLVEYDYIPMTIKDCIKM